MKKRTRNYILISTTLFILSLVAIQIGIMLYGGQTVVPLYLGVPILLIDLNALVAAGILLHRSFTY